MWNMTKQSVCVVVSVWMVMFVGFFYCMSTWAPSNCQFVRKWMMINKQKLIMKKSCDPVTFILIHLNPLKEHVHMYNNFLYGIYSLSDNMVSIAFCIASSALLWSHLKLTQCAGCTAIARPWSIQCCQTSFAHNVCVISTFLSLVPNWGDGGDIAT